MTDAEALALFDAQSAEGLGELGRIADLDRAYHWWADFASKCAPDVDAQFVLGCKIMMAAAPCVVARENL